jgi:hypothetical protein
MSKSQRRIYYHLKNNGLAQYEEHNETLREIGIMSLNDFKMKPSSDRRRIIQMLYDLGSIETANYLKNLK